MKYAIVTGSTHGIGLAIASALIDEGYFVFINGRSSCKTNLPDKNHYLILADVSCPEGINMIVETILKFTDKIDCLVLNAGMTCRKKFFDITYEDWINVMNTNINMPFLLVQKTSKYIVENGNILFISSTMALKSHSVSLPYGVSKSAVNSLSQGLVKELSPRGIRINSICPGFVNTEWQKEKPNWLKEKIESKIAIKRFAEPEEIATLCINVINNAYINGSIISIDGGYDLE